MSTYNSNQNNNNGTYAKNLEFLLKNAAKKYTTVNSNNSNLTNTEASDEEEIYDGEFVDELMSIINAPLTFDNIKKAQILNIKKAAKINKLIEKINIRKNKLDILINLYTYMEQDQENLDEYSKIKLLLKKVMNDKEYVNTKDSIKKTKEILKNNYRLNSKSDLNKKIKNFESRKKLLGKLNKLLKFHIGNKKIFSYALRELSKKIKGNIISKHPELAQFVDLLSCKDAINLRTLAEQYKFIPKTSKDFLTEVKNTTIKVKSTKSGKKVLEKKIKLLISVSNALSKNESYQKFIENEKNRQSKDRTSDRDRDKFGE